MDAYRHIAPYYDFLLQPFLKNIRHDMLEMVLARKPRLVLDVACGTGDQLRRITNHHVPVIGIDLSVFMLRQCRQANPAAVCLLQDGTAMGFRPASFDLVLISFALHECGWPAAGGMLNEIFRVLKPGGHLLITDYTDLKESPRHVRLGINAIEFLAGRRHYRNFRHYLHKGGLPALIDSDRFCLLRSRKRAAGSIEIQQYKRLDVR